MMIISQSIPIILSVFLCGLLNLSTGLIHPNNRVNSCAASLCKENRRKFRSFQSWEYCRPFISSVAASHSIISPSTRHSETRLQVSKRTHSSGPAEADNSLDFQISSSQREKSSPLSMGRSEQSFELPSHDQRAPSDSLPPLNAQGYTLMILLFFVTLLGALDRVAMSVAIIPMGVDLSLDETTKGIIAGLFSIGYMFALLPAGLFATLYSPKLLLAMGVAVWSLAQMASPIFANISLPSLYLCRFIMGVAEACTVPTVQSFVARWVREEDRSKVLGFVLSGFQLGTVTAYAVSPAILDRVSWYGLFLVFGAVGFLWVALWLPLAKDNPVNIPETSDRSNDKKPALIALKETLQRYPSELRSIPWKQIYESRQLKAIAVAHGVQNFGLYINLAWLPTFFNQEYGLNVDESSFFSVGPWIGGAIVSSLAGFLADKLESMQVDRTLIRRSAQSISLIIPALVLLLLSNTSDLTANAAVSYFIVATASAAACVAGFGSSIQDICKTPRLTAILYGFTSVPAVLLGSFGVFITGVLVDAFHDWKIIFTGVATVYCLGAIFYSLNYKAEKLFD